MTTTGPWTEQEKATLHRMLGEGRSGAEIGRAIGRSRSAVLGYCFRNRTPLPHHAPQQRRKRISTTKRGRPADPTAAKHITAAAIWQLGATQDQVAGAMGVHPNSVTGWFKNHPEAVARGAQVAQRLVDEVFKTPDRLSAFIANLPEHPLVEKRRARYLAKQSSPRKLEDA